MVGAYTAYVMIFAICWSPEQQIVPFVGEDTSEKQIEERKFLERKPLGLLDRAETLCSRAF
jgi:hypothetical protein